MQYFTKYFHVKNRTFIAHVFIVLVLLNLSSGNAQTGNPAPYCMVSYSYDPCNQPNASNTPGNYVNDFINGFYTIGAAQNISNQNTGCCGPGCYIYYCNQNMVLPAGVTVSCNIQGGTIFAMGFAIFVDWNQDNVFQVPAETCATTAVVPAASWVTATMQIPAGQANGVYRMRVRSCWATPGNAIDPCSLFAYGETEDYNIYVSTNPPPNGNYSITAGSNSPVCAGQTLSLSATYNGTVPLTYYWWGPMGFSSNLQNPFIANTTTLMSGLYQVSAGQGACGSIASTSVTIYPTPNLTVTPNPSLACPGNSAVLSASANPVNSYSWSTGSNSYSTVVTPTAPTTYTAYATYAGCTGSLVYTYSVNAYPQVTSSNGTLCAGSSATLTANGANNYTWTPGGTGSSINVSPSVTTVYTITGSTGTCLGTSSFTQTVNSLPIVNATTNASVICPGMFALLTGSGANSYTWNPGGTGLTQIISPSVTTTYTLTGAIPPCSNTFAITQSVSVCADLRNNPAPGTDLAIYPNPFSDNFILRSFTIKKIRLMNMLGKCVLLKEHISTEELISGETLSPGIYVLECFNGEKWMQVKLLKEGDQK